MLRKFGLYQHFALSITAPGASRDLREQREQPFRRAKIGTVEQAVGVEHADQVEMRKVVPFGENLGADQDVDLARMDLAAHRLPGMPGPRAVAVDAQNARPRKMLGERGLHALGALPDWR